MAYLYDLSLVIPAFGRPEKLAACLEAALNQSLQPDRYEVVVVDDCSPTPLTGVINHFRTLYPRHNLVFRRNEFNRGRAATRNVGIELSQGRVLFFLDLDNWLYEDALEYTLRYFEHGPASMRANISSPPDQVQRSSYVRYFNSRYLGQRAAAELATMNLDDLHERYFATDAVAVDRESIDRVGMFDEDFSAYGCEDEELGLRLADAGVPFHLALDVRVTDGDAPSVRRACERMIVYAQQSVPILIMKHPRYALHGMFPFLERSLISLSTMSKIMRVMFIHVIPFFFGKFILKGIEYLDRSVLIPGFWYKLVLTIYYSKGFKNRRSNEN